MISTPTVPTSIEARPKRRRDIQGLRALAVLLVVAFHAKLPIPGGFIGVDVFFVISGFVITRLLMHELASTGGLRVRSFFGRRMRRLLPALATLTTATALLSIPLLSPLGVQQSTAKTGLGATFFVANLVVYREPSGYFAPGAELNALLNTWSLSVEEQFYFLFPWVLLVGFAVGGAILSRRRGITYAVLIVTAASFGLSLLTSFGLLSLPGLREVEKFAFYSSATRAWEFGAGALLALMLPALQPQLTNRAASLMSWSGLATLTLASFIIDPLRPFPGLWALLPVAATFVLILAGSSGSPPPTRWLESAPMVTVGDLSYSWYLWHWPLIVFARVLWPDQRWTLILVAALSLIPAWLSYRYVETPIRQRRVVTRRFTLRFVGGVFAIPAAACMVLALGSSTYWGSDRIETMSKQVMPLHADALNGCDGPPQVTQSNTNCVWPAESPTSLPNYLVGDSTAGQYSEALIESAKINDNVLKITTRASCAFNDAERITDGRTNTDCTEYVQETVEWLKEQPSGIVVIASLTGSALTDPDVTVRLRTTGELAETTSEKTRLWTIGLEQVVTSIRSAGHRILLVQETPFFRGLGEGSLAAWLPQECSTYSLLTSVSSCGKEKPLAVAYSQLQRVANVQKEVADRTSSRAIDLAPELCVKDLCRTNVGELWIYRDGVHLTVDKSKSLGPTMARALRSTSDLASPGTTDGGR